MLTQTWKSVFTPIYPLLVTPVFVFKRNVPFARFNIRQVQFPEIYENRLKKVRNKTDLYHILLYTN